MDDRWKPVKLLVVDDSRWAASVRGAASARQGRGLRAFLLVSKHHDAVGAHSPTAKQLLARNPV
jgi:hypothetical protein